MSAPSVVERILAKAAEVASDPNRFVAYYDRPVAFAREILGVKLWKKQRDALHAIRDSKRVAIRSGHGVGKTTVMAIATLWWLFARKGMVVTTAPTWEHIADVLWREIAGRHARAAVTLPGTVNQTELRLSNDWLATGLSTSKPSAFQGRHHEHLLVIIDEAPGVSELVHTEITTLATGSKNCIAMIGNPTATSGTFYEAFNSPGIWTTLHISCLEHPNVVSGVEIIPGAVTKGWVEDRRIEWGEDHPFWFSRVLGEFPKISLRGAIPLAWVERAQNPEKWEEVLAKESRLQTPRIGGLDVARYGDNRCVYYQRRGQAIERYESWGHTSLMETAERALRLIEENQLQALIVDASGIGAGVVDRLLQLNAPVYAYNGGHRAFTPASFSNRRTEVWWGLRQRFERQELWLCPVIPGEKDQLTKDLVAPQYEITTSGRIKLETKENLLDRGVPSPDFADALALCFAMDEDPLEPEPPKASENQDLVAITPDNVAHLFPTLCDGF